MAPSIDTLPMPVLARHDEGTAWSSKRTRMSGSPEPEPEPTAISLSPSNAPRRRPACASVGSLLATSSAAEQNARASSVCVKPARSP